jgi:O-antigen/teichoic acid export membrane protein
MPISFVLLPIVAKYWDDGERLKVKKYLEYSTKIFLVLAIPASVGLYVLSKPLLQLLTTSEFVVGGVLTFLVALGYIFLGVFQINTLIILLVEKTKYRPLITGIAGVINIVLNIILIPQIGIMGAAVATLISYMVIALIVSLWARNVVNYSMDYIFLAKVIVSSTVMALIIQYLVFPTIFGIILVLVVGLAVYVGCIFALKTLSAAEKEILHDMMQFVKNAVIRTP